MRTRPICTIENCNTLNKAKGYCPKHYQRFKNHGDPLKLLKFSGARHGMVKTRTWYSWVGMIERATSDSYVQYKDYKGRGITVCQQWTGENGFITFYKDMGERPEGMTLDRIDNNGNYEPTNCKWSTYHEQNMNTRRSKDKYVQ